MLYPLVSTSCTVIYSNKKDTSEDTSNFHGTVSFDPVKMSQQKINQNVYQTPDTQKLLFNFIFLSGRVIEPKAKSAFPLSSES